VALQGNLDTFPLTDVLRLLSSTAKTGCLQVESARGEGAVWLDAGAVVAVEAPGLGASPEPVDVVFELLRFPEGTFAFLTDAAAPEPGEGQDVDALLAAAEALVAEWTAVEEVVPSLDLWASLVDELPADEVTLDAAAWRTITAIGSGGPVRDVGAWLEIGELDACRAIRDLVEAGLAQVTEPPEGAPAPLTAADAEPSVDEWLVEPDAGTYVELPPIPLPDELAPLPEAAPVSAPWRPMDQDRWDEVEREARAAQQADVEDQAEADNGADEDGPVEEVPAAPVAQLDELRTSDDDVEPALPDVEAIVEEQPIDRSRLLRFLGSVRN
jgi:hypothetical protein